MIELDRSYLTIHWDAELGAVWMQWKQRAEGDIFRQAMRRGVEVLQREKSRKWIADLRHLGAVNPQDAKWSAEEWFPQAIAAGMRYMAFIQPRKVVTQMTVKMTMTKVQDESLLTAYFAELEEARTWLRAQA